MAIWFQGFELADLNALSREGLTEHLGIVFTEFGDDWLVATMPVDRRTHQPAGLLHGGASAALAETVGSVGAHLCVDPQRFRCVGQVLYANHIAGARDGLVRATGTPVHLGGRSQVWRIEIRKPDQALVCLATLTVAVLAIR
jgi:1,4-dihydroxy-2-naphthoyl-CoA hydrolase